MAYTIIKVLALCVIVAFITMGVIISGVADGLFMKLIHFRNTIRRKLKQKYECR